LIFYALGAALLSLVWDQLKETVVYIAVYVFVECTMAWRALALTSGFPGSQHSKLLLWLSVVAASLFIASDTLILLNAFYENLIPAPYLSGSLTWLAQAMVTFSVPRRLARKDYVYAFSKLIP